MFNYSIRINPSWPISTCPFHAQSLARCFPGVEWGRLASTILVFLLLVAIVMGSILSPTLSTCCSPSCDVTGPSVLVFPDGGDNVIDASLPSDPGVSFSVSKGDAQHNSLHLPLGDRQSVHCGLVQCPRFAAVRHHWHDAKTIEAENLKFFYKMAHTPIISFVFHIL